MAAPKGNQFAKDNEGGRPTEYKHEYNDQAYKLCLLGATDNDLADFFNVTERTINNWKEEYQEFFQSINAGKEIAFKDFVTKVFSQSLRAYEEEFSDSIKKSNLILVRDAFLVKDAWSLNIKSVA